METRANFILIGVFTLLAIVGTLVFFVWLASVQIDRQYATYGILLDDVSGLDASGDVLFNGLSVGRVIGLEIFEPDPSKVLTTIEVLAATPVRAGTEAQLQSQGVTGVAYISLSGGTPGSAPLEPGPGGLAIIPSRRSSVQALVEDAPALLAEATEVIRQFQQLSGPENQAYVAGILRNLEASSGLLDAALNDFSEITGTVRAATEQITLFTSRLDSIGTAVESTLERADGTLLAAEQAFDTSGAAIDSAGRAFDAADTALRDQVPQILAELLAALEQATGAIGDLSARSGTVLDGFGQTAGLLNARLSELDATLSAADAAFVAIIEASDSFDALVDGDATLLVADARDFLAESRTSLSLVEAVMRDDVPAIVADIRTAVAGASAAVETVAGDLTGFTGRFEPLADEAGAVLSSASALFERGQITLVALEGALAGAQTALASAETAFDAATGVLADDLDPVLGDIRTAAERIGVAVQDVARDVPAIAADLRALIARADAVVAEVQGAVAVSAPAFNDFARTGLPELTRLSAEARGLVGALEGLVRRIERDPARFLLDDRVPDYRRD